VTIQQGSEETGTASVNRAPPVLDSCEWLVCPMCSTQLERVTSQLRCERCNRCWPEFDGIPDLIGDFPYWGEVPLREMKVLNRHAADKSWRSALLNSSEPAVQKAAPMILNLERANWHCLLPGVPRGRVLDVGAGMGTTSHALALHYDEVVALEPVAERVEFMRHRFAQEKLRNIRVVRSSVWALPFPKESFDLVAMNGVLEWVPQGVPGEPRALQVRALAIIYELLRPGGHVYIGIENRFATGYFIGYKDPHCGLSWVTILPRPLAQWYARRKGLEGYRNYLYSSRGYLKLLREAGFAGADIFAVVPSYNHPRFFIPLADNLFEYHYRTHGARNTRVRTFVMSVLLRTRVLKYCDYAFAILARK
jgi:SAM-dependent methyltransferase